MAGETEGTPVDAPVEGTPGAATDGEGQHEGAPGAARDEKGRFSSQTKTNGAAGDAAVEPQPEGEPVADWRKDLPEDLAKTAQKFTSPVEALKSYRELERRLGRSVTLPGQDATDEERAAFYKKLGVPDDPSKYEVKLPEDLPDELKPTEQGEKNIEAFKAAMHKAGATPAAVQAAVDTYYGMLKEVMEESRASAEREYEKTVAELEREWGQDYKANVEYGKRMIREFDPDRRFALFLEKTEVGGKTLDNHPEVVRFFAKAGRAMTEDTVHLAPTEHEMSTINEEISNVRQQRNEALSKGNRQLAAQLDEKERQLYARRDGNQPIVGAGGRTA